MSLGFYLVVYFELRLFSGSGPPSVKCLEFLDELLLLSLGLQVRAWAHPKTKKITETNSATKIQVRTRSYKIIPALIYAGFCYAKIFDLEFPYKNFGVAKSSVDLSWNFFYRIGSGSH